MLLAFFSFSNFFSNHARHGLLSPSVKIKQVIYQEFNYLPRISVAYPTVLINLYTYTVGGTYVLQIPVVLGLGGAVYVPQK